MLKSGAVLVPLNPRFKAAEIRKTADDAELSAVIAAPSHSTRVDEARERDADFAVYGLDTVDASDRARRTISVIDPRSDRADRGDLHQRIHRAV